MGSRGSRETLHSVGPCRIHSVAREEMEGFLC